MNSCPSDRGREAAYAAEEVALGGTDLDQWMPWAALGAVADGVLTGGWWRSTGAPPVEVFAARRGTTSSTARQSTGGTGGVVTLRLARPQWTIATLAHELSHALAGVDQGHGPAFRAAAVDVIAVVASRANGGVAEALRRAYGAMGLATGDRTWPAPHRGVGDGFVILPWGGSQPRTAAG